MEVGRLIVPSLHNHPFAIADARMARRTIDVVAFLSAGQQGGSSWKWHTIDFFAIYQSGDEVRICVPLRPRDCAGNLSPSRPAIRKEARAALGQEFGLILHVLAATGNGYRQGRHSKKSCSITCWMDQSIPAGHRSSSRRYAFISRILGARGMELLEAAYVVQ